MGFSPINFGRDAGFDFSLDQKAMKKMGEIAQQGTFEAVGTFQKPDTIY